MDDDGPFANRAMLYGLIGVILLAFGGFVWNIYGAREPVRIAPPPGAYKVAPSESVISLPEAPASEPSVSAEESSVEEIAPAPSGIPRLAAMPDFVSHGPFVAQLAALQAEDAIQPAWARLSSRAPELFASARLDVERADLGQRGIYYRLRAGYFADRTQASRFCDRIRQMGQDCIVVAR